MVINRGNASGAAFQTGMCGDIFDQFTSYPDAAPIHIVSSGSTYGGGGRGAGRAPPAGDRWWGVPYCSLTTTFVRSIWLRRLTVKLSLMESFSRFGYVYQ